MRIGNRTQGFEWYHFQWPWTMPNSDTPLFDAEYLRNVTRYRHSYDGILMNRYAIIHIILIWTYTRPTQESFRMSLSDLEWLSEIINDTKHARSLCDSWVSCYNIWNHWRMNERTNLFINSSKQWHLQVSEKKARAILLKDGWSDKLTSYAIPHTLISI